MFHYNEYYNIINIIMCSIMLSENTDFDVIASSYTT